MTVTTPLLRFDRVSKAFPGVQALDAVSFEVRVGEVHALVGENGAGKSTLMKILAGVYRPDSGQLLQDERPVHFTRPSDAQQRGISIIYQEFNLLPDLTVAENILIQQLPRNALGFLDRRTMNDRAHDLLQRLGADIPPQQPVYSLSVAQQQIVEIVKALATDCRLIIMDEPTAALNQEEVGRLFEVMRLLRDEGKTVIFISHRLDEVMRISDRVTVLKDGQHIATQKTSALTREEMVRLMVGRSLNDIFPQITPPPSTAPLLEVRGLRNAVLQDIDLCLYPGEVLGVAGLEGQGQRELARALFGLEPVQRGEIILSGERLRLRNPRQAIRVGMVFISDDRKAEGLALALSVKDNIILPSLPQFMRLGLMRHRQEQQTADQMAQRLNVKTPNLSQRVGLLSGGNQQKVVLAKWMLRAPRLLIFVEPTRGIDVGAKMEIYVLIARFAEQGAGVLMISSDLIELLGMSTRVLVMHRGRIAAELKGNAATEEAIMMAATGGVTQEEFRS